MSKTIIKVENLSKRYRIGLQERKADTFAQLMWNNFKTPFENFKKIKSLGKFGQEEESVHWALKDVDFEVKRGEVLGVIGENGAGKSTILKILSKITEPTSGRIEMNGRVAALLEVGTGFHPELTGRENIYLNGTILGMTKKEIDWKLDEIIDFSGVEKYIDTPVKFYSSGMRVRLGFSVAAHLEPEILIIDEVLAVGDYEFQQKCLGKMEDVSQKEGRTVLFVSHQMDAIARLCSRVLVLKGGSVYYQGNSSTAIKKYLGTEENEFGAKVVLERENETNKVSIQKVEIKANSKLLENYADVRDEIQVEIYFEVIENGLKITPGLNVHNEKGDHLFSSHHVDYMVNATPFSKGIYQVSVLIPSHFFAEGVIYFSVALMDYDPFVVYQHAEKIISLSIIDSIDGSSARGNYVGSFPGLLRPKLFWEKIKKTNF